MLNDYIDILAHTCKVLIDFVIWNSDNLYTVLVKIICSVFVFFDMLFFVVLTTVKLDNQLCFGRIKICNIIAQNFLS